jgi:hypothetical protein
MNITNDVLTFYDGNVYMWLEHTSSIMRKAGVKGFNDQVELTSGDTRVIARSLMMLAEKSDRFDFAGKNKSN